MKNETIQSCILTINIIICLAVILGGVALVVIAWVHAPITPFGIVIRVAAPFAWAGLAWLVLKLN